MKKVSYFLIAILFSVLIVSCMQSRRLTSDELVEEYHYQHRVCNREFGRCLSKRKLDESVYRVKKRCSYARERCRDRCERILRENYGL